MVFLFNESISLSLILAIDGTAPPYCSANVEYILFFQFATNRRLPYPLRTLIHPHPSAHPLPCWLFFGVLWFLIVVPKFRRNRFIHKLNTEYRLQYYAELSLND
jgi:hypothetical protein